MEWDTLRGTIKSYLRDRESLSGDDRDHHDCFHRRFLRAMAQDAMVNGTVSEMDEYGDAIDFNSPNPPENFAYGVKTARVLNAWTEWFSSLPKKQKRSWLDKIRLVFAARG